MKFLWNILTIISCLLAASNEITDEDENPLTPEEEILLLQEEMLREFKIANDEDLKNKSDEASNPLQKPVRRTRKKKTRSRSGNETKSMKGTSRPIDNSSSDNSDKSEDVDKETESFSEQRADIISSLKNLSEEEIQIKLEENHEELIRKASEQGCSIS